MAGPSLETHATPGLIPEPAARSGIGVAADDSLILSLCRPRQLDLSSALNDAAWDGAVRQLSTLPAQSSAGILAKAQLLRGLLPTASNGSSFSRASPDEQLLASLLDDLLGPSDPSDMEA